jgi:large repetitive protein
LNVKFNQVAATTFQGTVIAFARGIPETSEEKTRPYLEDLLSSDLYFNVFALNPDDQNSQDWIGFQPLAFPNTVRPAGMQIVNIPSVYDKNAKIAPLQDSGRPICVKASADYIYVFRQSKSASLLVNRFRLVKTSDVNAGASSFTLEPAWEVRFQRSGKPDTPADPKDVLNYLSPDKEPFLEPTLELFMTQAGAAIDFDAELLPNASGGLSCQIFIVDHADNRLDLFNFPLDNNGNFIFTGRAFDADNKILPDSRFTIEADKAGSRFTLNGMPSAVYYQKQERVLDASSNSYLIKRTGRLLLALNGSLSAAAAPSDNTLVTIDFSVAVDGTLARPANKLVAGPVGPANYAVEFGDLSYLQFQDLVLQAKFAFEFWMYPSSKTPDRQQIVGNSSDSNAPYLRLINGSQIEMGFTDAKGEQLRCTTPAGTIALQGWNHVRALFDESSSPKFQIQINGKDVECRIEGTGDKPNGVAVNQIGAASNGFVGDLDDLRIFNGGTTPSELAAEWPFDAIDYSVDPPTTPNSKDAQNPGQVFGAYLVPSASPVASDNAGIISYDDRNLTIYTAYFENFSEYGQITGAPYLIAGSDGLLHCYFKGKDDLFSVLQYDSQAARATFSAPWQTRAGTVETGTVEFVAAQSGAFMNGAAIRISPLTDASLNKFFCNLEMASPSGRIEQWMGVPRSLLPFVSTLNGKSTRYPTDPKLANGSAVFFDTVGAYPAAYIPLTESSTGGQLALITRLQDRLPLKSAKIDEILSETATVTLEFLTPRWGADIVLTQTWKLVPTLVTSLVSTLEGLSGSYAYKNPGYCNIQSYSLVAISDLATSNRVLLWVHPTVSAIARLEVADGPQPGVCTVHIELTADGKPLKATWNNVSRQQGAFAHTLEHDNADYDYKQFAKDDFAAIGSALIVTTNGTNAAVSNRSGAPHPDEDMLAGASLFGSFPTAVVGAAERITAPAGPVAATKFQSAFYKQNGKRIPLLAGTEIFPAMLGSAPHQGAVAFVRDIADKAALVRQGVHGGWLNNPAQRCLDFSATNRVSMSVKENEAPNIGQLTIQGDLTVELWCRPHKLKSTSSSPNQRLLTFNRLADPNDAKSAVRYMAGLRDCPSLKFAKDNTIRAAVATMRGTFYTWFAVDNVAAGIIGSISTRGVTDPVLVLSLNAGQQLQGFCRDKATLMNRPEMTRTAHITIE